MANKLSKKHLEILEQFKSKSFSAYKINSNTLNVLANRGLITPTGFSNTYRLSVKAYEVLGISNPYAHLALVWRDLANHMKEFYGGENGGAYKEYAKRAEECEKLAEAETE